MDNSNFLDDLGIEGDVVVEGVRKRKVGKKRKPRQNAWGLTVKQEKFVQGVLGGKTQSQAYLDAGFKKTHTYGVSASQLLAKPIIQKRFNDLQVQMAAKHEISRDSLVRDLLETRAVALSAEPPQTSAAVAATTAIAKLLGFDRQQIDVMLHRPGFTSAMLELDESEWQRQFDPVLLPPAPKAKEPVKGK